MSGVVPSLLAASTFAPAPSSSLTIAAWPLPAATIRGVTPPESCGDVVCAVNRNRKHVNAKPKKRGFLTKITCHLERGAGATSRKRPCGCASSVGPLLRIGRRVQLVDPTLTESINPQQMFQHLESCQPTPIPGPGTWQPKRLKPSSLSSLEVKILRKITSISAKLNEKTLYASRRWDGATGDLC